MTSLYLRALSERERILNVDTEVANRAFNLRVTQEDLDGTQIARLFINDGRLGAAQRMCAIIFRAQSNASNPFIN